MAKVDLEIRDVPEDVRDTLVMRAEREGKSLEEYVLELLVASARLPRLSSAEDDS